MSTSEFMPVTQDTAVKNNIEYSVKIGKQVMKKQLQAALKEKKVEYNQVSELESSYLKSLYTEVKEWINSRIHMNVRNDGEITRFRNMFNKFSRFDQNDGDWKKLKTNVDIIHSIEITHIVSKILKKSYY